MWSIHTQYKLGVNDIMKQESVKGKCFSNVLLFVLEGHLHAWLLEGSNRKHFPLKHMSCNPTQLQK